MPDRRTTWTLVLGLLLSGCVTPPSTPADAPASRPGAAPANGTGELAGDATGEGQADDVEVAQDTTTGHRWHAPHKQARQAPRKTPPATESDWNPLADPANRLKRALEARGVTYDLDLALISQRADGNGTSANDKTTAAWQFIGDWKFWASDEYGETHLAWTAFGAEGLGYDTDDKTLSEIEGSLSDLNSTVWPHPIIVDEVAIKHVSADGARIYTAGKVDLSFHMDTNRVANDGYKQFLAFSLVNNLSIPFPSYGGFGGWVRADFGDVYTMLGMADSAVFDAVAPWKTLDENSWYQLGELGIKIDSEALGKGTIRLNPWHNRLFGEDGWGLGLNVDQDLGNEDVVGFLRAGFGDDDVTPVEHFLSAGVGGTGLFDRPHDTFGVGASWSDPSPGNGTRSETLIESYYSFRLSPTIVLTPDLQLVLHPAQNPEADHVVVAGLRLLVQL